MYSFIPEDVTVRLLLFIGTFYLFVIIAFWQTNITRIDKPHRPQYLLVILLVFHLIFAFEGGDYFHYYEEVIRNELSDGKEPIYHWLASAVGNDFILWRLVIWGTALILFMLTAKRFGLDPYKVIYLLYVMFFTIFDYARASLGMAIFLFGASFWCKPILHRKWLSYIIIAPTIMYSSTFFHSSMYISCASALFVFVPVNKKTIVVSITLIPFLASALLGFFNNLVATIISNDIGFVSGKVGEYSVQVAEFEGSKFEQIRRCIEFSTLILPIALLTFQIFKSKNIQEHIYMLRLYKIALCIDLMSIFILVFSTSIILFNRVLNLSMLAVTLLFYYSRKRHLISNNTFYIIVAICLLQVFFNYFKRILGGNNPW